MNTFQVGYRAFLLRLWPSPDAGGGCRASLEDPHTGSRRAFASLVELLASLSELPISAVASDAALDDAQNTSNVLSTKSKPAPSLAADAPDKKERAP